MTKKKNKKHNLITKLSKRHDTFIEKSLRNINKVHPDYAKAKNIKTVDEEDVKIKNNMTGREVIVHLNRSGIKDDDLSLVLSNTEKTKQQKESAVAEWLFERGLESPSFLADLFRYKGEHTKETRIFKSQIRRDFDYLLNTLSTVYFDFANSLYSYFDFHQKIALTDLIQEYTNYVKINKKDKLYDYTLSKNLNLSKIECFQLELIIRYWLMGSEMKERHEKITNERERIKGRGIFIDKDGKIFSAYDKDFSDIIKAEMDDIERINKSDNSNISET